MDSVSQKFCVGVAPLAVGVPPVESWEACPPAALSERLNGEAGLSENAASPCSPAALPAASRCISTELLLFARRAEPQVQRRLLFDAGHDDSFGVQGLRGELVQEPLSATTPRRAAESR